MTYRTYGVAAALEELVAVADTEHITRAAEQLGVPQPTLSRSMARLSRELGVPLLIRDGRRVRLTRQALVLAEHARHALVDVRAGLDAVLADSGVNGAGRVVLGFLHSMGLSAVPSLLRGFRAEHPQVDVSLVQHGNDELVDGIVSGRIDLGLVSPLPDHPSLRHRRLTRQPLVAVVPDGHRLATRRRISIRELATEPMITMKPGFGLRTITDRLLAAGGVTARFAFESDELSTAAGLVAAGLGVAVLPDGVAAHNPQAHLARVRTVRLSDTGSVRDIGLAWRRETVGMPAVAALHEHIVRSGPAAFTARR